MFHYIISQKLITQPGFTLMFLIKSAKLTFPFSLMLHNQISSYAEITCCLVHRTYKTCPSPPHPTFLNSGI